MGIGFVLCLGNFDGSLSLPSHLPIHHFCSPRHMLAATLVLETWYSLHDEHVRTLASQPASPFSMLPHPLLAAAFFPQTI